MRIHPEHPDLSLSLISVSAKLATEVVLPADTQVAHHEPAWSCRIAIAFPRNDGRVTSRPRPCCGPSNSLPAGQIRTYPHVIIIEMAMRIGPERGAALFDKPIGELVTRRYSPGNMPTFNGQGVVPRPLLRPCDPCKRPA